MKFLYKPCLVGLLFNSLRRGAVSAFPNPLTDMNECRSDNTTFRICDRDGILTYEERQGVQEAINVYEMYNVTCQEEVVPIQMAVALVHTVRGGYLSSQLTRDLVNPRRTVFSHLYIHSYCHIGLIYW